MSALQKPSPPDPIKELEARLSFRISEYLSNDRSSEADFSMSGLRVWMVGQRWSEPVGSAMLECLAVLCWDMIRQYEAAPEREAELRRELIRQLDYLNGRSATRPASLNIVLASAMRDRIYGNLRDASRTGSAMREALGLPRIHVDDYDKRTST
jgi:hypothetical protein